MNSKKNQKNENNESFIENQKRKNENFIKNLPKELKKYLEILKNTSYNFSINGLEMFNELGEAEQISNTFIVPLKLEIYIAPNKTKSYLVVKGITAPEGEELSEYRISLDEFENGKWLINDKWGLKVVVNLGKRGNQIQSIKEIADVIEKEIVYQFIGFTEMNNKKVFLHYKGAIGTDEAVKVDLENETLNRFCFTNKEFEIAESLKITFDCLNIAPKNITLPILALTFMAPLTTIFEELSIPMGFLMWVLGPSQCKKTSMVSAFCSHFGNFNRNHSPMNFLDGIPSIEEKASKCGSVLVLCDDYYPASNRQEAKEMNRVAEKLIALCFDKISGARSKSNGEMRKMNRFNGQIIATGEIFPNSCESRMSRVIIVNIKKGDVIDENLKIIQEHQEELQYNMKKFIEYLINNLEKIKNEIPKIFDKKIQETGNEITSRTAEMIVGLYISYSILLDFAFENKFIKDTKEKQDFLKEGWNILINLGKEQNEMVETVSPINMITSAVDILTNIGKLSVVDYESAKFMKMQDINKDGFIGFYDSSNEINYVYPELFYKSIKDFYTQQGLVFPCNKAVMCKELFNQGFLYKTYNQERPQIRRKNPRTKKEETFIGLKPDKMYIAVRYNENGTIFTK